MGTSVSDLDATLKAVKKGSVADLDSILSAMSPTPSTGPKKEIKKVEPKLSLTEQLAGALDTGYQFLNRAHSATNAGLNEFGKQVEGTLARTPTPEQLQKQGKPLGETVTRPIIENLTGIYDAAKAGIRASDAEFKPGDQVYTNKKPVAFRMFTQGMNPKASLAEQLTRRAMDLSADVQTDPVALATGLGLRGALGGAKVAGRLAKTIPAVQRGLARANAIVDPLADALKESKVGAFATNVLGAIGAGPHQRMKTYLKPNELLVRRWVRPAEEVIDDVRRETLRLRGTQYGDAIDNYAQNNTGANPVAQLVRRTISERLASANPQAGVYPKPFNELTAGQKGILVSHLQNPFGVSPTWLLEQADKTIASMGQTEFNLMRSGVKPKKGQNISSIIDHEKWLDEMFGKRPVSGVPNVKELASVSKGTVPTQIYEAGLRKLVNQLPKSEWVRPMPPAFAGQPTPMADPGWVEIPREGILSSKLGGMQVPAPLKAALDVQLSRAGQGAGGEAKSWYIKNKDTLEWIHKNVIGTIKKGLVAATSTQNANIFSNQQVVSLALQHEGIDPEKLNGKIIRQAYSDVMRSEKGKSIPNDIKTIRKYTRSFDATEAASNYVYGEPRGPLEGTIRNRGTNFAFRQPTAGEAIGRAYLPNSVVAFQGTSEKAWKLAMYRTLVANGKSPQEAVNLMEKHLFDYSDRGVLLEIFDKFGLYPFATYPTKAFNLLMDTLVHHPEIAAKYVSFQRLKDVGYEKTFKNSNDRYTGPFTIPYGNPEDKNTFEMQRFFPFGAQVQGLSDALSGKGAGSIANALGMGQPGDSLLSAVTSAPLISRFYDIAQGINPMSEVGKPKSILEKGQPASDLQSIQVREFLKNLAPSQLLGRAAQAQQDTSQGKTSTNYPFSIPRTQEETTMQYGVGIRAGNSKGMTESKMSPEVKAEVKGRKSEEMNRFLRDTKQRVKTDRNSKLWDTLKNDANKFNDPKLLQAEVKDALMRLKTLPLSGRSVVKGRITDEGRETIYKQFLYVEALHERWNELKK